MEVTRPLRCCSLSAVHPPLVELILAGARLQHARQVLQDEEAQQGREVDGAQERGDQPPVQVQVGVRHLQQQPLQC